ncbi:MAG TPA: VanZ family protein [Acidobacteriaceae bacterium]|jgi:VanZ family protein
MRPVFFLNSKQPPLGNVTGWRWWLNVWAPVALAIGVICIESTGTFSAQNTSSWLRPIFERLFGAMQDATWDAVHHILRKTGHFLGYGTVGFTFLRAWLHTLSRHDPSALRSGRLGASVLAILSTALVASGDEFHQTFLAGRTGTPVDVLLDTTGACTMCLLVWLICWSRRTQSEAV